MAYPAMWQVSAVAALRVGGLLAILLLLCGCFPTRFPSQSKPSCSWTSQPLPRPDEVCSRTFRTLRAVLQAAVTGEDAGVRRLVAKPEIARRIIAYGRHLRADHAASMHVVPSIALDGSRPGEIGASFYLAGKSRHGNIKDLETVYLRLRSMAVVSDQPQQEW